MSFSHVQLKEQLLEPDPLAEQLLEPDPLAEQLLEPDPLAEQLLEPDHLADEGGPASTASQAQKHRRLLQDLSCLRLKHPRKLKLQLRTREGDLGGSA
jgi:hypothetical protein